jgi:cell division protein ZapE
MVNFLAKNISLDARQLEVGQQLQKLAQKLLQKSTQKSFQKSFFAPIAAKFFTPLVPEPDSIYLYGQVGRGKSMLMANFFHNLKIDDKVYFHFTDFMQRLHRQLYNLRKENNQQTDLIIQATQNIIGNNRLLCLDEFQIDDIADAMILSRIFTYIFERKVKVVFTSNAYPLDLYPNGLQRQAFLKFVQEVLFKNCQILNLDGKIDYRSQYLSSIKKYYFSPLTPEGRQEIEKIFAQVTDNQPSIAYEIELLGRKLIIQKTYQNIAYFDFEQLCGDNLGPADYQAICQKFKIIFLLNIPKLDAEQRNYAKRLMLFIDEVYENKVLLLVLAEVAPEEIYSQGLGAEAFRRTASRLNEITGEEYSKKLIYYTDNS